MYAYLQQNIFSSLIFCTRKRTRTPTRKLGSKTHNGYIKFKIWYFAKKLHFIINYIQKIQRNCGSIYMKIFDMSGPGEARSRSFFSRAGAGVPGSAQERTRGRPLPLEKKKSASGRPRVRSYQIFACRWIRNFVVFFVCNLWWNGVFFAKYHIFMHI